MADFTMTAGDPPSHRVFTIPACLTIPSSLAFAWALAFAFAFGLALALSFALRVAFAIEVMCCIAWHWTQARPRQGQGIEQSLLLAPESELRSFAK